MYASAVGRRVLLLLPCPDDVAPLGGGDGNGIFTRHGDGRIPRYDAVRRVVGHLFRREELPDVFNAEAHGRLPKEPHVLVCPGPYAVVQATVSGAHCELSPNATKVLSALVSPFARHEWVERNHLIAAIAEPCPNLFFRLVNNR